MCSEQTRTRDQNTHTHTHRTGTAGDRRIAERKFVAKVGRKLRTRDSEMLKMLLH